MKTEITSTIVFLFCLLVLFFSATYYTYQRGIEDGQGLIEWHKAYEQGYTDGYRASTGHCIDIIMNESGE